MATHKVCTTIPKAVARQAQENGIRWSRALEVGINTLVNGDQWARRLEEERDKNRQLTAELRANRNLVTNLTDRLEKNKPKEPQNPETWKVEE